MLKQKFIDWLNKQPNMKELTKHKLKNTKKESQKPYF